MLRPSRSAVLWMPAGKLCLQSPPPVAEPASVPLTCAWRRGTLDGRGVRRREPGRACGLSEHGRRSDGKGDADGAAPAVVAEAVGMTPFERSELLIDLQLG